LTPFYGQTGGWGRSFSKIEEVLPSKAARFAVNWRRIKLYCVIEITKSEGG
jgi:hypothetical protein